MSRTAFTQLRYSSVWLAVCTVTMVAAFALPVAALVWGEPAARLTGGAALIALVAGYLPTLRYYGVSGVWAAGLPVAGVLYLAMTWHSAVRYWSGERSAWKGRRYARIDGG